MAGIIDAARRRTGVARTTDTIPARLTPGEAVLPPDVVRKEGGPAKVAARIAREHTPSKAPVLPGVPGYADGGIVAPDMKTGLAPTPADDATAGRPPLPGSATDTSSGSNPVARTPAGPDFAGNVPSGNTPSGSTTSTASDTPNPLARPPGGPDISTQPGGSPDPLNPPPNVDTSDSMLPTGSTGASSSTASNGLAWNPTTGIVDQIRGITPQNVDAAGYTSGGIEAAQGATATGYDATGYDATKGTASSSDTNLSGAVDKVISEDSPIMQQARAQAAEEMNARGLGNSSMAVGAAQGAVLSAALPIAQGDVQNSQFNAQLQQNMTITNVESANQAAAFHADAQNQAAAAAANAKNAASQFNSAQAQQRMTQAAQLYDQAAQFSAAAQNAAKSQNAAAYNDAMQKFVDARNAAVAAQNDAENLARRDTAQIGAQEQIANTQAGATVAAAEAHAGGMVAAANVSAQAQEAMQKAGLTQQEQQFQASLGATSFNNFQAGLTAIETTQLEPDAKQNAISNYMSVWQASGQLPFTIDTSKFPPASGTTGG